MSSRIDKFYTLNRFGETTMNFTRPPKLVLIGCLLLGTLLMWSGSAGAEGLADRLHLSGYGNLHSMDHDGLPRLVGKDDPNDLFFQLREFSLFFDFDISDGILASLEMQAVDNATHLVPAYAYIDIDIPTYVPFWNEELLGGLGFRVGRILVPFLSYNENKPNFKQNLMSQPFTAWHISPVVPSPPDLNRVGWSDVGAMVTWNHEVGDLGLVDLKFGVIGGLGSDSNVLDDNTATLAAGAMTPTIRPRDGFIQNTQFDLRDNNSNKATVVKVTFVPSAFPIDIGASWYRGAWDPSGRKMLNMYGIHGNWLARDWSLKGEWVQADVDQSAGTNVVTAPGPASVNTSTGDYSSSAWYVEGSYIPLRWGPADDRYLRLVFRYDEVDTNNKVDFTPFNKYRITPGMELQFASNVRLRYEFQHSKLRDFSNAPGPFKTAGGKEHINMHMLSMIFWF